MGRLSCCCCSDTSQQSLSSLPLETWSGCQNIISNLVGFLDSGGYVQEYFLPLIPLFRHSRPPCFSSALILLPYTPFVLSVSKAQRNRVGRLETTWRSKKREQEDNMKRKLGRINSNHFCSITLLLSLRLGGWTSQSPVQKVGLRLRACTKRPNTLFSKLAFPLQVGKQVGWDS